MAEWTPSDGDATSVGADEAGARGIAVGFGAGALGKPILRPMMHGIQTTLTADQLLVITRWTLKTAIMYEYRESRREKSPRFFKPADRLALREGRPLSNVYVFAGHYVGNYALWTTDADIPLNIHFAGQRTDFPAYSMTFAIGQLALQLFAFRWPVESGATKIQFALPGVFEEATIQLCPVRGNRLWPPEVKFDDSAMVEFSNTWRVFPTHEQRLAGV